MGKNDKEKKGGLFSKPAAKAEPAAPVNAPAPVVKAPEPAPAPAPVAAPVVEVAPVVEPVKEKVKYVLGYNHDKMRQQCGKCGGTQILITDTLYKVGPVIKRKAELGKDDIANKCGFEFTCNDCKTKYEGQ